jgi:hypothetical protein
LKVCQEDFIARGGLVLLLLAHRHRQLLAYCGNGFDWFRKSFEMLRAKPSIHAGFALPASVFGKGSAMSYFCGPGAA